MQNRQELLDQALYNTRSERTLSSEDWRRKNSELVKNYGHFLEAINRPDTMAFHDTDHTETVAGKTLSALLEWQNDHSDGQKTNEMLTRLREDGLIPTGSDVSYVNENLDNLLVHASERYIAGLEHDMLQQSMPMIQLWADMGAIERPETINDRNTSKVRMGTPETFEELLESPTKTMREHVNELEKKGSITSDLAEKLEAQISAMEALGSEHVKAPLQALAELEETRQEDSWIAFETWSHTAADKIHEALDMSSQSRVAVQMQIEATRPFMGADSPFNLALLAERRFAELGEPLDTELMKEVKAQFQGQQNAFLDNLEARYDTDLGNLKTLVGQNIQLTPLHFMKHPECMEDVSNFTKQLLEASVLPPAMLDSGDPIIQALVSDIKEALILGATDRKNFTLTDEEVDRFHEETNKLIIEGRLGGADLLGRGNVTKQDLIEGFKSSSDGMAFLASYGIESWTAEPTGVQSATERNNNFREVCMASSTESRNMIEALQVPPPAIGLPTQPPSAVYVELVEMAKDAGIRI